MRVKRYIVNALPEAVSMIRTDLGKDAVILETKQIRVGGFLGMFRKRKMEVIAAVESGGGKGLDATSVPSHPAPNDVNAMVEHILKTAQRQKPTPGPAAAAAIAASNPVAMPDPQRQAPATTATPNAGLENEQFIINEIRGLKDYMHKLSKSQRDSRELSEPMQALKDRLVSQEMDAEWIEALIEWLEDEEKAREATLDYKDVRALAASKLQEWLEPYSGAEINPDARVIHFVGPTGVGKTTSIAKLAAEKSIKHGKRIGFITSDTYRIAAVEQLRTYATILDAPLEVVFSPMDLPKAYKGLEDCDLILMDTAGRNFRSELHVSEVNSLLQTNEPSESILVMSLTAKTKDMAIIADRFCKFGVHKILFTKLDETTVYGAIFNLMRSHSLYPTHIASGQTVPDDIEPFQLQDYIALLLGALDDA